MPRFAYRALAEGGEVVEGEFTTDSRERAIDLLDNRRLVPLAIEEVIGGAGRASWLERWSRRDATGQEALLEFTRDFGVLVGAGVPVGRALAILSEWSTGDAPAMARRLLSELRAGASLASAMESGSGAFPGYYVGMVRAGEEGSSLPLVLDRLTVMLERSAELRAQLRSSLAYPALVLCLSVLTIVLLLVLVVPEFRPIFEESAAAAPLNARILLHASDIVRHDGWAVGLALLALLIVLRRSARSETGRLLIDRVLLRLPVAGSVIVKVETARLCRTLGTLVVNGVVLIDAARIATAVISNRQLAAATRSFVSGLAQGEDAVHAIGHVEWLPARVRQVMAVGAESGQFGEMLVRIGEIYEAESSRAMRRLVGMVAPLTTLILGGMIGTIVWTVVGTILDSYSQALQ